MAVVSILFLLILIPLIFGIPILIGIYVYRDANKRGMNAVLWTLIALLTPSFLGLIIYLLARNNYSDLTCPNCNAQVEESYVVCPNCRTKLRPTCEVCGTAVQTTWKVCPHCGTDLPAFDYSVATPVRKKDTTLGKILIAILVIPIVLIILLMVVGGFLFGANGKSGFAASGVTSMTMSEFMENLPEHEQLYYNDLFELSCTEVDGQKYHVLFHNSDYQNDIYTYQYLICIPGTGEPLDINYHGTKEGKLFNKLNYLNFDILCDKMGDEGAVFIYSYEGTDAPPEVIRINHNGQEVEITPDVTIGGPFLPMNDKRPTTVAY
ncbi:MAG: zinc ribbon domain-containing protein [Lachnospiraceae bacterium]|nr:zinc ribbon domain-containing protein [Lachnospiraceae bacterium]